MNNFREGLNALREISDPEKAKLILEKITGKKLADYEGIDALVGTLMGYYNEKIKNKVSKNGATMTGNLTVPNETINKYLYIKDYYADGQDDISARLWFAGNQQAPSYNDRMLWLDQVAGMKINGNEVYHKGNLDLSSKVSVSDFWKINLKVIGNAETYLDLNDIFISGTYRSTSSKNKFYHLPDDLGSGAFELTVTGITPEDRAYTTQILKAFDSNKMYIRSFVSYQSDSNNWTRWIPILNSESKDFLGSIGMDDLQYIQANVVKEVNKGYIDKTTGKPYRCIKQAPANIITPNAEYFVPIDNISMAENKVETIYTGSLNVQPSDGNITLSQSISKFNFIIVYNNTYSNNKIASDTAILPLYIDTQILRELNNILGFMVQGDNEDYVQSNFLAIKYINDTTLYVNYNGNSIYKIVGVRY